MDLRTFTRPLAGLGRRVAGPRHTTAVAYLALFVAMGGTAYAAATISSADIINDSVRSIDLKNGAAVGSDDVIDNSITGADIREASLSGVARDLSWSATGSGYATEVFPAIGGWTLKAECDLGNAVYLLAKGPAGAWHSWAGFTPIDATEPQLFTSQTPLAAGQYRYVVSLGGSSAKARRLFGVGFLSKASGPASTLRVDFNLLVDSRDSDNKSCLVLGTATRAIP